MEDKNKGKPGPKPEVLKLDIPLDEAIKRLVTPKQKGDSQEKQGKRR